MTLPRLQGAWLTHPGTQALCAALEAADHRVFFVGGCVRNALMDIPVADIDLATDALPHEVIACAEAAGLRPIPTGLAHGTITVVAKGRAHEITTFRRDIATDGRHAKIVFCDNITEDAARRDFTINALYAQPDGQVLDPLGGMPDLLARNVRFVGDAMERITEDYLRILRFFRFHAHYAGENTPLDSAALKACQKAASGIETLSRERVGHEMRKLLAAPSQAMITTLKSMAHSGILDKALSGAQPCLLERFEHSAQQIGLDQPGPLYRIAALGGHNPVVSLRLSKAEYRSIETLIRAAQGRAGPAEMGYRLGADMAKGAFSIRMAHAPSPSPTSPTNYVMAQQAVTLGAEAAFPIRAADLAPLEGAPLGQALRALEQSWIDAHFKTSREALLKEAQHLISSPS